MTATVENRSHESERSAGKTSNTIRVMTILKMYALFVTLSKDTSSVGI